MITSVTMRRLKLPGSEHPAKVGRCHGKSISAGFIEGILSTIPLKSCGQNGRISLKKTAQSEEKGMNTMKKKIIAAVIAVFTMSILASCGANETEGEVKNPDDAITLGSFVDTEGGILGNMILLALEDEGYLIDDKVQFGTPDVHRNALLQGELDLGVDYTGNGQFYSEGIEEDVWRDKDAGYDAIKVYDEENNDLIWMKPANANNTEALAVKREFAEANGLSTMEDFADYVNGGGEVKLITSQLFAEKESGLLGMEAGYGFELESDQLILLPHGNTAET